MSFDIGSLSPELLREILQDKRTEMAQLTAFEQFCDVRTVSEQEGSIYIWNEPMLMPDNGNRTSEVAPDADTPQGNASTGTRSYNCPDYRFAMRLNRMAEKSLSTMEDGVSNIILKPVQKVLGDYNLQIANVLKNGGASGTFDDVTEKAASNTWDDTTNGTPLEDIDSVIDILGVGCDAILGANVARVLGKHPDVTGSVAGSGREYVNFDLVRQFLMDRGCGRVFILGGQLQDAEPGYGRNYGYLYQDVFALSIPGNLVAPKFLDLEQTIEDDRLNKRKFYVAEHSHDIITGYAAHTYGFTGIIS